jgi:hypothetical protein
MKNELAKSNNGQAVLRKRDTIVSSDNILKTVNVKDVEKVKECNRVTLTIVNTIVSTFNKQKEKSSLAKLNGINQTYRTRRATLNETQLSKNAFSPLKLETVKNGLKSPDPYNVGNNRILLPELIQQKDRRISKVVNFSSDFTNSFNNKLMTPIISKATILSGVSSPMLNGDVSPIKADVIKAKLNSLVGNVQKTPNKVRYELYPLAAYSKYRKIRFKG